MSAYTQLHVQLIFAVSGRESLIDPKWEDELFKYINGIIVNNKQKLLVVNGVPDHIHMVLGFRPDCRLSDLVRELKKHTNAFINEGGFTRKKFSWQEGYGAFSCSKRELDNVIKYVLNQKVHHFQTPFKEEYIRLLKENEIDFNEKYLFKWIE
jgi:REP element-mobilizing transposase RayT